MQTSTQTRKSPAAAPRQAATLPMWVTARQAWEQVLGCSKQQFYQLLKDPAFPRGRVLSPRNHRWSLVDLEAYMRSKVPAEVAQRRADRDAGREVLPAPFSN